jgi:hypothetical protein
MRHIIQTDNKQEMIDTLQSALTEGEKFAKAIFNTLIEKWGADKFKIDQIGLIEMGTGHFIHCVMKGVPLGDPAEYITNCLAQYSDVGLAKMGLTRAQYEEMVKAKR